ncbi:MAG: 4Fe-4S cluster-binding domain-containing protein [Alphaproteobacteria bacterium]|nr:4Fe-4S cluster-binding domain-containing protein [Alphaproteobacteria bacterium]MBQ6888578.1 4Fe-4S cluster-binding domain-containing protein [Lachnospiraceae bacterium]
MLRRLIQAKKNDKYVVIVGCSLSGNKLADDIKAMSEEIRIIFADNDVAKQQNGNGGYRVIGVNEIKGIDYECCIIASVRFFLELSEQLRELGVVEKDIYYTKEILQKKDMWLGKRFPRKQLVFVVDLAEHCNLNCQNCDHFSPLADEKYADIGVFENDMQRMAELFCDEMYSISEIYLEGGEPLLNKNAVEFIKIVGKKLPKTQICIFTNGLLIPKQEQYFWDICREYHVRMVVTKYPINFDYDKAKEIVVNNGVEFQFAEDGNVVKTSLHKPLDLRGSQDKYISYMECYMGNGLCNMLKNGKLYPCTVVPNIDVFNRYFKQNVQVCEKDYIDIYKAESAEEIMEFLTNPIPACRYCQPQNWTAGIEWKTTTFNIREWAE